MPLTLETDGQVCPFPLVEAKQAIAGLDDGDHLTINFDRTGDASWTITVQKQ